MASNNQSNPRKRVRITFEDNTRRIVYLQPKTNTEPSKITLEHSNAIPEQSNANPKQAKMNQEQSKENPTESKANRSEHSKPSGQPNIVPGQSKTNPEHPKANSERPETFPAQSKSNPSIKKPASSIAINQSESNSFSPNFQILRKFSIYNVNTWAKLSIPFLSLAPETVVNQILNQSIGLKIQDVYRCSDDLQRLIEKLIKNAKTTNFDKMVKFHCRPKKSDSSEPTFEAVAKRELSSLFRAIFHRVVPKGLIGDPRNVKKFESNLKIIISSGKRTPILLHHLMMKIDPGKIAWLQSVSDCVKAKDRLLARLLVWLTLNLFWKVLTNFFNISDSSNARNEWLFYHKRNFQSGMDKMFSQLTKDVSGQRSLKPLTKDTLKRILDINKDVPNLSKCRVMPKKQSGRLICAKVSRGASTGQLDTEKTLRILLNFASKKHFAEIVDVRGTKFHSVWSKFVSKIRQLVDSKIFVVIADIKDAFGSVIIQKLRFILQEMKQSLPAKLFLHKIQNQGFGKPRFREIVSDQSVLPGHPKAAGTKPREIDVGLSFDKIRKRILLHTLKLNLAKRKKYFLITKGLVQGDSLSSLLCDIYYGHLVKRHLSEFQGSSVAEYSETFLARGMDDFIFASTDQNEAQRFLSRMQAGFPEYGCSIRSEKTVTNFPDSNKNSELIFCGSLIDQTSLSCRPDFSSYFGSNIAYATTFNCGSIEPGLIQNFILNRMLFLVCLKIQPLFIDVDLNGFECVLKNIFEIHFVSALRFHSIFDSLVSMNNINQADFPKDFLIRLLRQCLNRAWNRFSSMSSKFQLKNEKITRNYFSIIFYKAFQLVLSKHSAQYVRFFWQVRVKKLIDQLMEKSTPEIEEILKSVCSMAFLKERKTTSIISHGYQRII